MFDLRKVFIHPLNDKDFGKKFVIGSLVMFFPTVFSIIQEFLSKEQSRELFIQYAPIALAASVIAGFFACVSMGYYFQIINKRINKSEQILPDWKMGINFVNGIKAFLGSFLLIVPFCLFLVITAAICFVLPFLTPPVVSLILLFALIIFFVGFIFLVLLMNLSYAHDLKLQSYFNFKRANEILSGKKFGFLLYMGLIAATSILSQLFSFILFILLGIISLVAIVPLTFYVLLLNAEIAGQFLSGENQEKVDEVIGE